MAKLTRRSTDGIGVRIWWYDNNCRIVSVPKEYRDVPRSSGWRVEHAPGGDYHRGQLNLKLAASWGSARAIVAKIDEIFPISHGKEEGR